ncbi:perlucin-like protein [Ostrea edulis]|uniref:perlucin-like protein n=1 Tax=Ostrea edulis TaxID=37623 RepID=UPI0024AEACE9|nr:perlucin-like protein [Ostrea edulis]
MNSLASTKLVVIMIRTAGYTIFFFSIVSACLPGWHPFNNSCYHVSIEDESWMDGMKMCEIHGGYLVHIETAEEDNFITQQMQAYALHDIWVGGSDWTNEGTWVWEPEGKTFQYFNFAPHKPNNAHGQNCLSKAMSHNYQWDDEDCDDYMEYICEKANTDIGSLVG